LKVLDAYALSRKAGMIFKGIWPQPVWIDHIVLLDSKGNKRKEISLYPIFKEFLPFRFKINSNYWDFIQHIFFSRNLHFLIPRRIRPSVKHLPLFFHTNTITFLDHAIPGICKNGDLLIALRDLNMIAIIDPETEKLLWHWGKGVLDRPHHPTLLPNGNILIFDNGMKRKYSRIIEINPHTFEIIWEYHSAPLHKFFSATRGASQRLPNGNTLITESDRGRVFEVTRSGNIVWEFYNPAVDEKTNKRRSIYRMIRIINPEDYPFLKNLTGRSVS